MCRKKPYPRCSNHAYQELQNALESGDSDRIQKARMDYLITPAGIEGVRKCDERKADRLQSIRDKRIAEAKRITDQRNHAQNFVRDMEAALDQSGMTIKERKAYSIASEVHANQVRRDMNGYELPYITHPAHVRDVVKSWTSDNEIGENLRVASLLHDAVEDYKGESEDEEVNRQHISSRIKEEVGGEPLKFVWGVTNPLTKGKTYKEKSESWREHVHDLARNKPLSLVIKLADLGHNAGRINVNGVELDKNSYRRTSNLVNKYRGGIKVVRESVTKHAHFYRENGIDYRAMMIEAKRINDNLDAVHAQLENYRRRQARKEKAEAQARQEAKEAARKSQQVKRANSQEK